LKTGYALYKHLPVQFSCYEDEDISCDQNAHITILILSQMH